MKNKQELLKKLPGVDKLLLYPEIKKLLTAHAEELIKYVIRFTLDQLRQNPPALLDDTVIVTLIHKNLFSLTANSLKKVYNATGIIVYTNLGRAPFSDQMIAEASETLKGYNNLEYNLVKGERGSRNNHLTNKLKYLTGAEDVLIVNNNAAAVIFILRTFAKEREVIISRGELIEIGGSFRIPEIMAASDCKMVEVGSTNKTHLKDYANAVNDKTAILFKAHKSNYVIQGFTQEVGLQELVLLGKKHNIPVVYDMGSGLLKKSAVPVLKDEPDVMETLKVGVDLVSFSGDKLIGGPQAGIIAGKAKYISKLKNEPLMRALRVGKTTLAYMETALNYYLDEAKLMKDNLIFAALMQTPDDRLHKAEELQRLFTAEGIPARIIDHDGYCGGGALPGESIPGKAVQLDLKFNSGKEKSAFSEKVFYGLLKQEIPVVSILRKGELILDTGSIPQPEIKQVASIACGLIKQLL